MSILGFSAQREIYVCRFCMRAEVNLKRLCFTFIFFRFALSFGSLGFSMLLFSSHPLFIIFIKEELNIRFFLSSPRVYEFCWSTIWVGMV